MSEPKRRRRSERGATVIEAAFALPIVLVFVLSLVDLSQWAFESTQAASAARDGARMGILRYSTASDRAQIANAVNAHLGRKTAVTPTIECVNASTNGTPDCSTVDLDGPVEYRIRVSVSWPRTPFSPVGRLFGKTQTVKGTATMTIVGLP